VVEALTCGLPTFATCNGGPSEIIKHGKSGFHIDPYHGDAVRGWGLLQNGMPGSGGIGPMKGVVKFTRAA
jgi:glycosyltransferase involved in cell wall biosynthesis